MPRRQPQKKFLALTRTANSTLQGLYLLTLASDTDSIHRRKHAGNYLGHFKRASTISKQNYMQKLFKASHRDTKGVHGHLLLGSFKYMCVFIYTINIKRK